MKLILERWRKLMSEMTDISIEDYRNPSSAINLIKQKITMALRSNTPIVAQGDGTYEVHPGWVVLEITPEKPGGVAMRVSPQQHDVAEFLWRRGVTKTNQIKTKADESFLP